MTTKRERTAVLGAEYDERLKEALLEVLRELGGGDGCHSRGIAGSQDVETFKVEIDGEVLVVEAETYVGLSVRGDSVLVGRVESMVRARTRQS